jgi:hypothetical protein
MFDVDSATQGDGAANNSENRLNSRATQEKVCFDSICLAFTVESGVSMSSEKTTLLETSDCLSQFLFVMLFLLDVHGQTRIGLHEPPCIITGISTGVTRSAKLLYELMQAF